MSNISRRKFLKGAGVAVLAVAVAVLRAEEPAIRTLQRNSINKG